MKHVGLVAIICIICWSFTNCFGQSLLTIRAIDDKQQPLREVKITIIGWTGWEFVPQLTDDDGRVYFEMKDIGIGREISITGALVGYRMKNGPHRYTTKDTLVSSNYTEFVMYYPKCGFLSLKNYIKDRRGLAIGLGLAFGVSGGERVLLGNVPSDIRITPPHPDDVRDRLDEILPPSVLDNYLIHENDVRIKLGHRKSIDVFFCFWGMINVAVRTSTIRHSGKVEGQNYFGKDYLRPEFFGKALIYYSVESKERQFLDRSSFSLPIYLTYPVLYYGKNREVVFRIVLGTNAILPERIDLQSEQGWDRFGARQVYQTSELGELKEIEWFSGIDFERTAVKDIKLGIQCILVYTDYQENLKVPLSLQLEDRWLLSARLNVTWLIWR
jgi:hypothetical protein